MEKKKTSLSEQDYPVSTARLYFELFLSVLTIVIGVSPFVVLVLLNLPGGVVDGAPELGRGGFGDGLKVERRNPSDIHEGSTEIGWKSKDGKKFF